ncbi:MAG: hypothetical protein ABSD03_14875 [Vulcanimicrobiaceae bacterium]|jgi:hypothetical protein
MSTFDTASFAERIALSRRAGFRVAPPTAPPARRTPIVKPLSLPAVGQFRKRFADSRSAVERALELERRLDPSS